jgi:adenylylsulfate kinase
MNNQPAMTFWLTGLSGSGKSTLAHRLRERLIAHNVVSVLLDGDVVRTGISNDLGYDAASRTENLRRIACMAQLLNAQGVMVICATISPLESDRAMARTIIGSDRFKELYVSTPLHVCEERDPKGLYRRARAGEIPNFTGISAVYEVPSHPDRVLDTVTMSPDETVEGVCYQFDV